MRQPKWLGALVLALAVAAGFAALGQWQLGHAITQESEDSINSEDPVPLLSIAGPGDPVTDSAAGRVVTTSGTFVPEDTMIVSTRLNQGDLGYWVVGHLLTDETPTSSLAVAVGWAETKAEAERALAAFQANPATTQSQEFEGRYMPAEGAPIPEADADLAELTTMAPSQLVNLWAPFEGLTYPGFFVSHEEAAQLELIDSVPPLPQDKVNWLNLFYAAEWVVFAGFALYFWYRITKDAWEKVIDELDQAEEEARARDAQPAHEAQPLTDSNVE